jgi:hypothetical protein
MMSSGERTQPTNTKKKYELDRSGSREDWSEPGKSAAGWQSLTPMTQTEYHDPFGAWAESISSLLASYRQLSGTTANHGDILGKAREFFVSEILRRFLPQALHVGSGEILASDGKRSKQIDILIYRHDIPLLSSLASTNLYFVEGVIAALEIKSFLDSARLCEALDNCRSVKVLDGDFPGKFAVQSDFGLRNCGPAAYILGYRGYKTRLSDLKKCLFGWIQKNRIESILHLPEVIVTEGVAVVKNDYRFNDSNGIRRRLDREAIFIAAGENAPLRWLLRHLIGQIGGDTSQTLLRRDYRAREEFESGAQFWGTWDRHSARIVSLDE